MGGSGCRHPHESVLRGRGRHAGSDGDSDGERLREPKHGREKQKEGGNRVPGL